MSIWMSAAVWLAQAAAQLPDTIVTKQIVAEPSVFDRVASIASGLMTIAILVLTVAVVPAAWNFRKSYLHFDRLLKRIEGDIQPIMRHASTIADNVDYVTTAIRADVQQVSRTIASANEKLVQAMQVTESRIADFNALIEVAQQEAESALVNTASTLHGVAAGAAAYRERGRTGLPGAWEEAGAEAGGLRPAVEGERYPEDPETAPYIDLEEESHGDDGAVSADGRREAPRVRRRGGRGRNA